MYKKGLVVAGLAGLAALLAGCGYSLGLFTTLQEQVYDRFFTAHQTPQDIVIVAIDDESITALGGWPFARKDFATALAHLGAPRAVGIDVAFVDASPRGVADDATLAQALSKLPHTVLATQYDNRGEKLIEPLELFAKQAREGYANMRVDAGGVIRSFTPTRGETKSLARALQGEDTPLPQVVQIDWRGPAGTVTTIPFIDVYRGTVPTSVFNDKTVLLGVTANDVHDILATPVGIMPGVEVHANALATLESGHFFVDTPYPIVLLLIVLISALAAGTLLVTRRLALLIALLLSESVAIFLSSVLLFTFFIRLPVLVLLATFLLSAGLTLAYQYLTESKEKRHIREMFQYYLMPEVIEELATHPERLALGGREATLTMLFCDIRGFTAISEGLSAAELTVLINEYLTAMTDAIMAQGGLVDKYIGDAVMAFWGAPVANPTQERDTCRGALAMIAALDTLNVDLAKRGIKPIHIGIGASTGEVVVGNMGSSKRFNYTVMGDEVNFASRIEGLTKVYGVSCIVGERTAKAVMSDRVFTLRELDLVMVKGKSEPRIIYELVSDVDTPHKQEILTHFAEGRHAYMKGEWANATAHFTAALALGADGPSTVFLERTQALVKHPPADWKGVWEFTTK